MLRSVRAVAAAFLFASAPLALTLGHAHASDLSEAYNHQTDRDFRVGLQMRLAWTGDYAGDFSGDVDARSLRAVRDFQARHGMEANGIISEPFLKQLVSESDTTREALGFALVDDGVTGLRVALPMSAVADGGRTPIGRVWRSADGAIEIETVRMTGADGNLDTVHAMLASPSATRSVTSEIRSDDGFTITGVESGRPYVMRFKGVEGDVRGFGVSYDPMVADHIATYAVVATNLFDPDIPAVEEPVVTAGLGRAQTAPVSTGEEPARRFHALLDARATPEGESKATPGAGDVGSSGSGFVVSSDGWVLTNAHVAGSCKAVMVGDKGLADKVIVDEANDIAAVHVGAKLGAPLPIADGMPRLGEDILALGFPLRSILADSLNVTRGNVSSLRGLSNDARYLQISAPVQPGNSGGPLVDLTGRVVGVVTAKLDAIAIADATGDIPQSINFAIRPDTTSAFLKANGIAYTSAKSSKDFGSVADTTAKVQDSVLPVLCLGEKEG
ncbi:serine protease [Aureimonas psammosilenae]|uniref:serine protease n=1 Tax=Aureimonas psammosilenae TaxID=2495496 RepID=UPI0012608D80|nr:serine protease [Aureimonas psammosilenae]